MNKRLIIAVAALLIVFGGIGYLGYAVIAGVISAPSSSTALSTSQTAQLQSEIVMMKKAGLNDDSKLAARLLAQGIWQASAPDDAYLKGAEADGDTPFAYTLSSGHHPSAIVLAPRFFTDATDIGRAAFMIHEMGHYRAYVATGKSTEFDGYKAEYDKAKQIGLSDKDGIVYFGMLDGVGEYVVPIDKSYANKPDIKAYLNDSNGP